MNKVMDDKLKKHKYFKSRKRKTIFKNRYYAYTFIDKGKEYNIYVAAKPFLNDSDYIFMDFDEPSVWGTPMWVRELCKMCTDEYFKEYDYNIHGKRNLEDLFFDFSITPGRGACDSFEELKKNGEIEWYSDCIKHFPEFKSYLEQNGYEVEVLSDNILLTFTVK